MVSPKAARLRATAIFLVEQTARVLDLLLVLSAAIFVTSAGIITYSITMRKLERPVGWPDPLTAFLLLWGIFLAAGATYFRGDHVNMDTVVDRLPARLRTVALLVADCIVLAFALILSRSGWHMVRWSSGQHEMNPDLAWLMEWIADLAVFVGAILLVLGAVGSIGRRLLGMPERTDQALKLE